MARLSGETKDLPNSSGSSISSDGVAKGVAMKTCPARVLALLGATALAGPAWAGEQVLYEHAPDWVEPADFASAVRGSQEVVLLDRQRLLDGGTLHSYEDVAVRLKTPEAVRQLNTMAIRWQPDKGDLHFHRLEIVRPDETIDVLAGGAQQRGRT